MNMDLIVETGLVAIIRGTKKEKLFSLVDALQEGGVRVVEVTCNTPGAVEMIGELVTSYGKDLLIGAGTVLDGATARMAILAGAEFILSPHLSREVLETANLYGKPAIPGVMTPTEVTLALKWGARMVKVFPAAVLGTRYFKDLHGPLPQAELMAVGGVNLDNAADFIRAGAVALGIGGNLTKVGLGESYREVTAKAREYLRIIKEARN